jgi:hypothetical protein
MAPQPNLRLAPTLPATSSAVRTVHYLGGEVSDKRAAIKFVDSCFDPATGGFSAMPGSKKPDVFTTAVGVLAIVELKMPLDMYEAGATKYLSDNARLFEEIRIAAAAFEALGKPAPRKDEWLREIRKMENTDGTYGKGGGQARATGSAAAAILRLGGKLDSQGRVLQTLKAGQRKSGGFGKEEVAGGSDLETTYRVIRAFKMMQSRPDDIPALQGFIAKCRNSDGGYGVAPGEASTVSGTYYAAIIRHWLSK